MRGDLDPSISLGEGADKAAAAIADAKNKALAALAHLGSSFTAEAFTSAMNLAVINFATGSAEIPADSTDLIDRAAAILKTAPTGTIIEIGGHTDNTEYGKFRNRRIECSIPAAPAK